MLYQAVLIPGAFLIGFLLSPLLVLSRHIASKPSYRLRWPAEKDRNRKLLAAASLLGVCAISVLLHGGWVAWQLQGGLLTSWSWAARFVLLGADGVDGMHGEFSGWTRWRRLALALYWLSALFFAVGGWQRRLTKTRRLRIAQANSAPGTGLVGEKDMTTVCNGVRDERRQYHHQHISLDLRRKFFHAMVVIVFVPGIAFDVSEGAHLISFPLHRNGSSCMVVVSRSLRSLPSHSAWPFVSSPLRSSPATSHSTP